MALEDAIADIAGKLRDGAFPNEQSVSQHVVLRILSELHWDVFEPSVVWPEYATKSGTRADFALCEPRSKPKVLIEVKQPGKAQGGIRQALEYAFHEGAPLVVLTDGLTWSFYLPAVAGDYEDRLVVKLDLGQHSVQRCTSVLERYLHWRAVASGKALEDARSDHQSKARRALARRAIPGAWRQVVQQSDGVLIKLIGDAVVSKEGFRPEDEDVRQFLAGLGTSVVAGSHAPVSPIPQPSKTPVREAVSQAPVKPSPGRAPVSRQQGVVTVLGTTHSYRNAKEKLVIVLRELAERDPSFLDRCYRHQGFSGRTRRYIARQVEELYPTDAKLRKTAVEPLPGGWWLGTNLSNASKDALIQAATDVAGVRLGVDIVG